MAKDCNDFRFEQSKPPEDFCDPLDGKPVDIQKDKLEEKADELLAGISPESDCYQLNTSIAGPDIDSPENLGSEDPQGPFVLGLTELSELCKRQMAPHIVTGIIMQMLVRHFSEPSNFFNRELRSSIKWSPNARENKLRIQAFHSWAPEDAEQVPAILLKRKPFSSQRIAMGDRDAYDKFTGAEVYTRMVEGSHELICIGGNNFETEILGFEVGEFFTVFSRSVYRIIPMYDMQVESIGEIMPLKDLNNKLGIVVSIKYNYPWVWSLQRQGPLLKSVTLKV